MRARAVKVDAVGLPASIEPFVRQVWLTLGREYEVEAIVVHEDRMLFQLVNDIRYPSWYPSLLFEITDGSLPADWRCNSFRDTGYTVFGPEFIVASQEAYERMATLDWEQVENFWRRIDAREASSVDDEQT